MNDKGAIEWTDATDVLVVDRRCFCDRCEGRTDETYQLLATCLNCGEKHVAVFRKGDRHGSFDDCPHCGVTRLQYGTAAQAREALARAGLDAAQPATPNASPSGRGSIGLAGGGERPGGNEVGLTVDFPSQDAKNAV